MSLRGKTSCEVPVEVREDTARRSSFLRRHLHRAYCRPTTVIMRRDTQCYLPPAMDLAAGHSARTIVPPPARLPVRGRGCSDVFIEGLIET